MLQTASETAIATRAIDIKQIIARIAMLSSVEKNSNLSKCHAAGYNVPSNFLSYVPKSSRSPI